VQNLSQLTGWLAADLRKRVQPLVASNPIKKVDYKPFGLGQSLENGGVGINLLKQSERIMIASLVFGGVGKVSLDIRPD
jgi:hypothetical protein